MIAGLETLLHEGLCDLRFGCELAQFRSTLRREMIQSGFADTPLCERLIDDICDLAQRYSEIMALKAVEARLEIVTTDSCRKFHADYVPARLISTYVGTGTHWLDGEDAKRVERGQEPQRTNILGTGDVGLFKGKRSTGSPAIHRSPPIAGTDETRLLLVLNPVDTI